jgi:hypothetical protein
LSFEATEHLLRDRLSWIRFYALSIADPVPDAMIGQQANHPICEAGMASRP